MRCLTGLGPRSRSPSEFTPIWGRSGGASELFSLWGYRSRPGLVMGGRPASPSPLALKAAHGLIVWVALGSDHAAVHVVNVRKSVRETCPRGANASVMPSKT